jgi:antitoxin component of MazEF toxin-antitoxin module
MVTRAPRELVLSVKLLSGGHCTLVPLPGYAAKACNFKPGSYVRVLVLGNEIRVRPVAALRLHDEETYEEYRERLERSQD